jgi:magnesium transporter
LESVTTFELNKELIEQLKLAVDTQDRAFIQEQLENVNYADICAVLYELDEEEAIFVIKSLPITLAADVIAELDEDVLEEFLDEFDSKELAQYVEHQETDDAKDLLDELPIIKREEVIGYLKNKEKARYIQELLRYEEDCAGGLMGKELIKANMNWNVEQCIDEIRRQAKHVDKIYSVYVVDDDELLLGRVALKKLLLAKENAKVGDIYNDEVISVYTYQPTEEVAAIMQKYDLEALPVINVQGKLVGRITIDDVIDVITEMAEQERQIMAGISEDVEEDDSVWMLSRARLPWLIIGLVGGIIGARFIGVFEDDLAEVTAIAFFIPLIMATGGNVGIQSSALVVQSLATPQAFQDPITRKLFKVFLVALINGIVLAGLVYLFIYFTSGANLAYVVSAALFTVVLLASFFGTVIPLALDKIGFNPALASGPFITTTIDLMGLLVYFMVAHALFNL